MNAPMMRALLLDAFYQVIDNMIFRVLLFLVLGIIAAFFLIGFREHEMQVLFGVWDLGYEDLFKLVGASTRGVSDVQGKTIQGLQSFLVESLGGSTGMVICLSATAFFMPRMLEKGSADLVFSKPISRWMLLLSRYCAGLLFVGILSCILVGGLWLAFLVSSGYNDPGFLWGALTLVYLFALLHAFSMCVGVFTRSTVAAILLSVLFYAGTGCTHQIWITRGYSHERAAAQKLRDTDGGKDQEIHLPEVSGGAGAPVGSVGSEPPGPSKASSSMLIDTLVAFINGLHYTLPKTSDADILTLKLRKALATDGLVVSDETAHVAVVDPPEDWKLVAPPVGEAAKADFERAPAVWAARDERGVERARLEISRRTRIVERPDSSGSGGASGPNGASGKKRARKLSVSAAADEILKRIHDAGAATSEPVQERTSVDGAYAASILWSERDRERTIVVFVAGDWLIEISADMEAAWRDAEARRKSLESFSRSIEIARDAEFPDPSEWYAKRFGWTAELPYNAFFSIGSSAAFALALLVLAWWKLKRIDF